MNIGPLDLPDKGYRTIQCVTLDFHVMTPTLQRSSTLVLLTEDEVANKLFFEEFSSDSFGKLSQKQKRSS